MMRLLIVASLCGVLGCQKASEAVKSGAGSAAKQGKPRGPSVQRSNAAAVYTLPPSERVFCLDIDGDGTDEALGAQGSELWAYDLGQKAAVKLWSSTGKGVVHRIVAAEEQGQFYLYLARGIGRGPALNAPLSLSRVLASKGTVFQLWEHAGVRNEPAHLSLVENAGQPILAFAHYVDKYHVGTRHMSPNGAAVVTEFSVDRMRMASSWALGDINGDNKTDVAIGRVYGDAKGLPGDLKLKLHGGDFMTVKTDRGVRGLVFARDGKGGRTLFVADGWHSNYGKMAKAQLKTVEWTPSGPKLESVGRSPKEFTFFELWARDVDGDGQDEVVARGNSHVSIFSRGRDGKWTRTEAAEFEPVMNVAFCRGADGHWRTLIPNNNGTRTTLFEGIAKQ
ncbi:MAG: FG-GAP repeat domain-containing protein [Bradymonadia bacterium]